MSKLLLIDDEADVQYSFQRIFDSPEIELTAASSGEEGLRLIPKLNPDLVIMDIRMGGITGMETLRRIRQMDSKLLVILMTAYGTTQTAIEAMKLGAYDYLLKPFDVPRLKEIVFNALKAARDMKEVVSYRPLLEKEDYELGIVGRSEGMQQVFKLIGQLAASDATALITGESDRRQRARAPRGRPDRSLCQDRGTRFDHRRKWHRQGTRCPRHLSPQQPKPAALSSCKLRSHPRAITGK
jgi:DNA-binding NtrC family response regulator